MTDGHMGVLVGVDDDHDVRRSDLASLCQSC